MLPLRDGVGPSCVGLAAGPWLRLIDFLAWRFPAVPAREWARRAASGELVDDSGRPVPIDQPYRPHGRLFYYRSVPPEARVAGAETVLFEDDFLVVADKPHFLPVTPAGRYLQETLLVRLRRKLRCDGLAPLHRIDRETAGVVLFAKQPATRARYEALFARRLVAKTYQAIAPSLPSLPLPSRPLPAQPAPPLPLPPQSLPPLSFPLTRASVLVAGSHFMQMREWVDGPTPATGPGAAAQSGATPAPMSSRPANAITTIDCLQIHGAWARYQLRPLTGQRHQLRVQMAALGLAILGDRIYPRLLPVGSDDAANPLRLLAQSIGFVDPVTGQARHFESRRRLAFPGEIPDGMADGMADENPDELPHNPASR